MQDPNDIIIDPWTALDFKKSVFGDPKNILNGGPLRNAAWLSTSDRRRLSAYTVLAGYMENTARRFLDSKNVRRDDVREYGDASLVIEQALSAVMGEQQQIVVDRADEDLPDETPGSTPPGDALDPGDRAEIEDAIAWQDALRDWAEAENFDLTVLDAERRGVGLGDMVYVIYWDAEKGRPRVESWDPGFYFPVLPDDDRSGDYPTRVHFVWEKPADTQPDRTARLVRLTYELGKIEPERETGLLGGEVFLREGDRIGPDFQIIRDYPWNEEPSDTTCYMTQREWKLSDVGTTGQAIGPDNLDLRNSVIVTREEDGVKLDRLDLRIDFLPVVHIPNVYLGSEHFGQSILTKAAQILDDLQAADTDSQRASATTGSPILAASNVSLPTADAAPRRRGGTPGGTTAVTPDTYLQIRPGMILTLGVDGKLSTVDTSANLKAMRDYVEDLRGRFTQNVRIPDVALGLVGEAANTMSGIAIELRYGPMQSLIRSMRMIRTPKYVLLLKFIQRFLLASEKWQGPAQTVKAQWVYGSFMPKNLEAVMKLVTAGVTGHVLSLETAVLLLQQAGMPIEDAVEEVAKIQSRMFDAAVRLADATNDTGAVYDFLGLDRPTIQLGAPLPPPSDLPATGGRPAPEGGAPAGGTPAS